MRGSLVPSSLPPITIGPHERSERKLDP